MKNFHTIVRTALLVTVLAPLAVAQDVTSQLRDYTRTIGGDGLTLSLVHLNEKTVAIMFQPPTMYAMRARARENTLFYVQGTAQRDVELDTTNFTIEQDGQIVTATPVNIKHFTRGKVTVPRGERVDGVLAFARLIDVSKPFRVRHGSDSVEFRFTQEQIQAMTPAAQQ
jgi:archaellum component FlaG (FlaF/FlaG flagellin family)